MGKTQTDSQTVESSDVGTIAVRSSSDLAELGELEKVLTDPNHELPPVADDPAEISREIIMQLLSAETDEELEQVGSAIGLRDLLGVPIQLHGFKWRPSSFEEGQRVFFVVFATRLDTGERIVATTGSGNVLAQLCNRARRGTLLNAVVKAVQADRDTKQGFRPYWLVSAKNPEQTAAA